MYTDFIEIGGGGGGHSVLFVKGLRIMSPIFYFLFCSKVIDQFVGATHSF